MLDLDPVYALMLGICGVGILIDAFERVASASKYADDGLYSWVVLRQRLVAMPPGLRRAADLLCAGAGGLMIVLGIRVAAVFFVVLCPLGSATFSSALTALVLTHLYICVRTAGFGAIGADAMTLIVCGGAWLATVVADGPLAARSGLWFIALQSCLGYLIAGISKLKAPKWRSGEALAGVLSTHTYGHPKLHAWVQARPRLAWALCWSVMLWETTFPIVLFVPDSLLLPLFGVGVLFHASLAALMGLNLFVFAFASTYVAIWAVRH